MTDTEKAVREALVGAWNPIATAPKDGRTILAYFPLQGLSDGWERIMPVKYRESMMPEPWIFAGRAASSYSTGPTHWMPLPVAPGSSAESELDAVRAERDALRKALERFLPYHDAEYVPNTLFDIARAALSPALESNHGK